MTILKEKIHLSKQYDIFDYLEKRLQMWSEWFSRNENGGLGYPRYSIEGRLAETGGILVKSEGPRALYSNTEAEEIEELVKEMHKQTPKLAITLRAFYLDSGTAKIKARYQGISRAQFSINLDLARQWLIGNFTAQMRSHAARTGSNANAA